MDSVVYFANSVNSSPHGDKVTVLIVVLFTRRIVTHYSSYTFCTLVLLFCFIHLKLFVIMHDILFVFILYRFCFYSVHNLRVNFVVIVALFRRRVSQSRVGRLAGVSDTV